MVGKNHKDLMRSIREYVETLDRSTERNFAPSDFFIESTYKDSTGRTLPCYLLTKKGCDKLGISRALLNATDVARLTGYSRGAVRSKFRFGGTSHHRVISCSKLVRQIADPAMYQPE